MLSCLVNGDHNEPHSCFPKDRLTLKKYPPYPDFRGDEVLATSDICSGHQNQTMPVIELENDA